MQEVERFEEDNFRRVKGYQDKHRNQMDEIRSQQATFADSLEKYGSLSGLDSTGQRTKSKKRKRKSSKSTKSRKKRRFK